MSLKINLLRPDDLLVLQVETENLQLDDQTSETPFLTPVNPDMPAYLIYRFPPQTVIEQAVFESSPVPPPPQDNSPYSKNPQPEKPPALPAKARIGGPSRLVFRLPPGASIPYNTAGLLDWSNLELVVSPIADIPENPTSKQVQAAPVINAPGRLETAIELPYRLVISPSSQAGWQHAQQPKRRHGRTELWHTRLALRKADSSLEELSRNNMAALRAIWSPDYNAKRFEADDEPKFGAEDKDWPGVLTPMTASDRHELVVLTSAFRGYINDAQDYTTYLPKPFHAEQIILSPLGGWLKSRGNWQPPVPFRRYRFERPDRLETWNQFLKPLTRINVRRDFTRLGDARGAENLEANLLDTMANQGTINISEAFKYTGGILPIVLGEQGASLNLSEWVHVATLGRDHYVRIVYEGHLYPFGHRAALIKVTERKIRDVKGADGLDHPVAYLIQRMLIVVRQPVKDYTDIKVHPHLQYSGRALPLKNIRLTTLVTPDIAFPKGEARIHDGAKETTYSFWVRLGDGKPGTDFKFHAVAEDIAGNKLDMTASMIFIPLSEGHLDIVKTVYDRSGEARASTIPGQAVTYAPRKSSLPADNTTLTTQALYFTTHSAPAGKELGGFLPRLFKARVNLPAVEAMLGRKAETTIALYQDYLSNDLVNPSGVFAQLVKEGNPGQLLQDVVKSEFAASQAGGIATPNMSITSLAREYGPLAGDPAKAAADDFDPAEVFKGFEDAAKLFGSFSLLDLLPTGKMGKNAPKLQFNKEDIQGNPNAKKLVATLDWEPKISSIITGIINLNIKNGVSKLEIHGLMEKTIELPPQPAPVDGYAMFEGKLNDFTIDLIHIIEVLFQSFSFKSETGKKPDVKVLLEDDPVRFQEDLQFVEELRKQIPPGLFGDGPSLDITAKGVKAGFGIGLPPISVGVFSLREVNLSTFLELPFMDGRPTIDFAISSREHPFNLTVAFLGGGGFFHMQLDTLGMKMLELALEFGASASIDLGVASGGVYIMAGIYLAIERKTVNSIEQNFARLSGYLRMGGELSVLGLISVSLEFNLSFTYESQKNAASGRATLTVKIEILFFSASVEITVEKRFGGSSGDPKFHEVFETPSIWQIYAGAFA